MKKTITILTICLFAIAAINTAEAQSGKIIVQSDEPSEGLYVISDVDEEKYGFGKYDNNRDVYVGVIALKYEDADNFHNGLAPVKLNGKWGVIDRDEKVVIPFKYDYMHSLDETYKGLAWVKINEQEGLIDRTGREIIPVKYDMIGAASMGGMYEPLKDVGLVSVKYNGKWGALTLNGEGAIPVKYDEMGSGNAGMVPAEINKKWGVLDLNGKVVIPFKYDYTYFDPFRHIKDLIFVHLNHKKGVIDKTGKTIVPVIYDDITSKSENFIGVKLKDKWGFFNKQGKEIAPPRFEDFFSFKNGLALVEENGRNFYIDGNGVAQKNYVKYFDLDESQVEIQGQYDANGKKTGEWKEYYKNGQLKEICSYSNGEKNGIYKMYYEDGTLWMHMDKFVNGKREGQWKSYHQNGQPWTFSRLVDDKENGEWANYYKNGNVEREGRKVNGKETGEWKKYYENGKLEQVGKMENGKAVGLWKIYYENGKLQATGEVKDGKQTGDWKFYNEDGSFKETKNVAQAVEKEKEDILEEINRLYKKSYKFTTEDGKKIKIASVTLDGTILVRQLSDGRISKTDLKRTGNLEVNILEKRNNYYISGGDYVNFFYEISTKEDAIEIKDALERLKKLLP